MPEWYSTEFGLAGLIVFGLVYVLVTYIKSPKVRDSSDIEAYCTNNMLPYITDALKTNTELITLLRSQSAESKRNNEKQQEVMQGMVIAINNLVALSQETLSRIKELNQQQHNSH